MDKPLVWDDPEGRFRIVVAPDRLTVTLEFLLPGASAPMRSRVLWGLTQLGVRHGLNLAAVDAVLAAPRVGVPFPIARGTPPEPGAAGSWEVVLSPGEGPAPEPNLDGSVDFRRVRRFREVKPGELLARHLPPGPGAPGVDCYGDLILPPAPRDPAWMLGTGTCLAPDNPELVVSATSGILVRRQGTLAVEESLHIQGSVDYETGDVDVSVPVFVSGDVKPGFLLRSKASVTVRGCVQSARVEAEGDLDVRGGVMGEPSSEIQVMGDLKAAYLHNARIHCEGDVQVRRSTVDCAVNCGGSMSAGEKLIGSQVIAEGEFAVGTIGSELGAPSRVIVGLPSALRQALFPLVARRKELLKQLLEIEMKKKELVRAAAIEGTAASGDAAQQAVSAKAVDTGALRDLASRQKAIQKELSELDSREAEILRSAPPPFEKARVHTLRKVLAGTVLGVGGEMAKVGNAIEGRRSFAEADIRRGKLRVLAVGSEEFQEQIVDWGQTVGLWGLRLLAPEEDWASAIKFEPPEFVFFQSGGRGPKDWKTLERLASWQGCAGTFFLYFAEGEPPEVPEEDRSSRLLWIPEPPSAAALDRVGKSIGLGLA